MPVPLPSPLVSVVMPAYKATWLAQALESIRHQTYRPLEVVICDDSRDQAVQTIVEAFAARVDFPVRYARNPNRLWEVRSTARAIGLASGEYIKFLHDDDVLHDDCIASLVDAFDRVPELALAAVRRRLVDETGSPLPDEPATAFPAHHDVLIHGHDLIDFFANHSLNFLGEPSAVLCRRAPLLEMGEQLSALNGEPIRWLADLAMYVKLLRQGPVAMFARPLVDFRISRQQFSQQGRDRPGIGEQWHQKFRHALRELGWCRSGDTSKVRIAALELPEQVQLIDLPQALEHAMEVAHTRAPLLDWQARRRPSVAQQAWLGARLGDAATPLIDIFVMDDGCSPTALRRSIASVHAAMPLPGMRHIHVAAVVHATDGNPVAGPRADSAAALLRGNAPWLMVLNAGTELLASGVARLLAELLDIDEKICALRADEWHRDASGDQHPMLQGRFDLDLLLGDPASSAHHWIFRRAAVMGAGGFDADAGAAAELGLLLRLVGRHGDAAIRHLPEPLLICHPARHPAQAFQPIVLEHLHQSGHPQVSVTALPSGVLQVDHGHSSEPKLSIIVVVSADVRLALLERCVISLLEKTRYSNYELLLVDNGAEPAISAWMQQVEALAADRIRSFRLEPSLRHAAACNLAATQSDADFLLFLRPEVAVLQPEWLHQLMGHGQRPDVGVVGAKTICGEGRITHAGLVPALFNSAGFAFAGLPMDAAGYMNRLLVAHACTAVADSCLLVARGIFHELGGFDHEVFAEHGADVDLCLRIAQHGLRCIWTPHALLLHSREATAMQVDVEDTLLQRWQPELAADITYNPSLRLDTPGGYRLGESDFSWQPLPARPQPRILAQPADPWGSGQYRVIQPFEALKREGHIEGVLYATLLHPLEQARIDPDVVILQRRVGDEDLGRMQRMRGFSRAFKVYELDDYLPNLPAKNVHREHMPRDVLRSLRRALSLADRFVVSTPMLADAFAGFHQDIRVAPNRLPIDWWRPLPAVPLNTTGKPRVGWAGGLGHTGDLEMIADVVSELAQEVDWVFFGMCPDRLRPHVAEFHPGVDIAQYPRALALLRLDLAIAPLEQNRFNECKSNLRLLEYGACAVPVVCSDVGPYRDPRLPVTRVRNRHREWVAAIRDHLADAGARRQAGDTLKSVVHRDWMLEGAGLEEWRAAWLP